MRVSVDDGCASDIRLSTLCNKYDVDLIIYLPVEWQSLNYDMGYTPLTYDEVEYLKGKHEIGSHSITHRLLTRLTAEDAKKEIEDSGVMLEKLLGVEIEKFAPPRGYTNEYLTELTLKNYESQRLTVGDNLVHIHPESGANNNKPWRDCVNKDTEELWCHSYDLDRYNLWEELEDYLSKVAKHGK